MNLLKYHKTILSNLVSVKHLFIRDKNFEAIGSKCRWSGNVKIPTKKRI